MPLYEYQCPKCGLFELIRKFSDDPVTICPTCGSEVQKLASAPAFHLKGTGWYVTDYAKKGGGEAKSDQGKSEDGKPGGGKSGDGKSGESKPADSKPSESKSETKSSKDSTTTPAAPSKKSE